MASYNAETVLASAWASADNDITGTVVLSLDQDLTYSSILSGAGNLTIQSSDTTARTVTFSGTNTFTGNLSLAPNVTFVASDANSIGTVPTAGTPLATKLTMNGGTISFGGTSNIELDSDIGVTFSANSTINTVIDDGNTAGGNGVTIGSGGDLTINGIIAQGTHTLNITGGDNSTYLPSVILNGTNTGTGTINVPAGVSLEVNGALPGTVALSGDLRGSGTVGSVNSNGGRVSPGSTVGTTLAISNNFADVADSSGTTFYFGFEGTTTAVADRLTVGGTTQLLAASEIIGVPYTATVAAGTHNLIESTGTLTWTDFSGSDSVAYIKRYSDGTSTEDTTGEYDTSKASVAVTGNNVVLTLTA